MIRLNHRLFLAERRLHIPLPQSGSSETHKFKPHQFVSTTIVVHHQGELQVSFRTLVHLQKGLNYFSVLHAIIFYY